jgi:ParB family chromosome partitioning protein
MNLDLPDLDVLMTPRRGDGSPLLLALEAIDEDPKQPRIEFDDRTLQELAESIRARGVRQPVSVRPHPEQSGRYVLNFGARRLRASRMAGRDTIPAFVDETADDFDQVAENEQRKGLTPLELALFVKRKLDEKLRPAEIARRLGKSKAYITYACSLIDPPDWLMQAYRQGRVRGLAEIDDLRKLFNTHGEVVAQWCSAQETVTRGGVSVLKARLEDNAAPPCVKPFNGSPASPSAQEHSPGKAMQQAALPMLAASSPRAGSHDIRRNPAPARANGLRVVVQYGEVLMEVATDAKPRKDRIPVRPLGTNEAVQHVVPGKLQLVRVEVA